MKVHYKEWFWEDKDDLDNLITKDDLDFSCENKGFYDTENMTLDKIDTSNIDIESLVKKMDN